MLKKTASIISYLTHPLWLPSIAAALGLNMTWVLNTTPFITEQTNLLSKYWLLIYVIISSVFIPLGVFQYLLKNKKINSLKMKTSQERITPTIILLWIYLLNTLLFSTLLPQVVLAFIFMLASYVTIVNLTCIYLFKFKISLHTSSITAIAVTCLMLYIKNATNLYTVLGIFCIAILVGFARWQLKAHNILQIIAGYLLGISTVFFYFST